MFGDDIDRQTQKRFEKGIKGMKHAQGITTVIECFQKDFIL